MCKQQKTWHILGAGAIGSLWAVRLHEAGVPVRLILSPRRQRQQLGPTLPIRLRTGINTAKEKTALHSISIAKESDCISNLLIATKANDVLHALDSCRPQLEHNAAIVSLSNGMGYHEAIAQRMPSASTLAVTTTEGAYIDENNRVVHAGRGQSKIAVIRAAQADATTLANSVAQQLSVRGHRLHKRANYQRMLLDKLLINACINALTAIYSCENGRLLSDSSISGRLHTLISECQLIARANKQTALANTLPDKVRTVITATAANYSSTYTDVSKNRITEIAFINGYLTRLASEHAVSAPENKAIVEEINQLEQGVNG